MHASSHSCIWVLQSAYLYACTQALIHVYVDAIITYCAYIYIYIYMPRYSQTLMLSRMYAHVCIYTHTCMHTAKNGRRELVLALLQKHTYIHTYIHLFIHKHTYMHTYTHTYIQLIADAKMFSESFKAMSVANKYDLVKRYTYIHTYINVGNPNDLTNKLHTYTNTCIHTYGK